MHRKSEDYLCRDGAYTAISLNKRNSSELPNTAAISPFGHITWPTSVSIHDRTLKGGNTMTYVKIVSVYHTFI